jgi:hypothetical protein
MLIPSRASFERRPSLRCRTTHDSSGRVRRLSFRRAIDQALDAAALLVDVWSEPATSMNVCCWA